jgi:hypothetical protein
MCISKKRIVYVNVYLKNEDKYFYIYETNTNISIYLKLFISSKIRSKLYHKHLFNIKPIWYYWLNNTYYYREEDCYIKLIYNYK